MTQNQGSEPVPASRTGQLISARDMAMQKFEKGMRDPTRVIWTQP